MGISKTALFSDEQNELADLAKVLAHPARIAILQYLLEAQSCVNSALVKDFGLSQPTVSQHLNALKASGLIQGSVRGTSVYYCIHPERWHAVADLFATFFKQPVALESACNSPKL